MTMEAVDDIELLDLEPTRADLKTDVLYGLSQPQKWISSMHFYDEKGSLLFDQICELPEYYLTRTEINIMKTHAESIKTLLDANILLVEFGSGSSAKSRLLLDNLDEPAGYVPVDIAREHLLNSAAELQEAYPDIPILPVCADFTAPFPLPELPREASRNIIYFPGSTIGNFEPRDALSLLRQMRRVAGDNGALLIGVDLEKDASTLEQAYDDAAGITAAFNKNVLIRLNHELNADFNPEHFEHHALWNNQEKRVEMHLVSDRKQNATVAGKTFSFSENERIHTESSYKYPPDKFKALAHNAGFRTTKVWTDPEQLFSIQYLESV